MPKYGYLVVEGPHDTEFVYRLLSPLGFSRVQMFNDLDPYCQRLVSTSYPHKGDLQKRMPTPLFLRNTTHEIAIHCAIGDSRLAETLGETRDILDLESSYEDLTGVGILLDADSQLLPKDRYQALSTAMQSKGLQLPSDPGGIDLGPPRIGAFVLPDNKTQGTLEDLLLECGEKVYPTLLQSAAAHVDSAFSNQELNADDRREINKPAGKNKAIISAAASILRPGKSVQVSIQDNRWLRDDGLTVPRVQAVQAFLADLLELK